jgi:DNA-binding NtrC family response regulator
MNRTKQIMIADDDDAILDALGAMLEYKGYDVRVKYCIKPTSHALKRGSFPALKAT